MRNLLLILIASFSLTGCITQPIGGEIIPVPYENVDLGDNRVQEVDLICQGTLGRTLTEVKLFVSRSPVEGSKGTRVDCITTFIRCNSQGRVIPRAVPDVNIPVLACS